MTGYSAYATAGGALTLSIAPVTYQVRVAKLEATFVVAASNSGVLMSAYRYSSSSLSGGSVVTPAPFRDGAAAATAVVKSGATASGTQKTLTSQGSLGSQFGSFQTYSFTFDVILSPGGVFQFAAANGVSGSLSSSSLVIHFEELHLARSV